MSWADERASYADIGHNQCQTLNGVSLLQEHIPQTEENESLDKYMLHEDRRLAYDDTSETKKAEISYLLILVLKDPVSRVEQVGIEYQRRG